MIDHDWVRARLPDYAAGELSADDRRLVDEHLAGCADCRVEAQELHRAYHGLALAAEPLAPPAALRERVLGHLAATAQPLPSGVPARHAQAVRPMRRTWVPALAAAAVVLAFGWLAIQSDQRAGRLAVALTEAQAEQRRLRLRVDEIGLQADLAVAILTSTDLRTIELAGADGAGGAQARAYWSLREGLLIVADQLPPPPEGRTYQVWVIEGSRPAPISAGLLQPEGGRGMLLVPALRGVTSGAITVAVTDEPRGGLRAPTGNKHLIGS
jgi:anti-sigma-K factor RskA